MNLVKESSVLVGVAKAGKNKYWKHKILREGDRYYTASESWSDTKDGQSAHLVAEPSYCSPKNVGRSNETTSEQQAELEWAANIKLKLDKGYIDPSGEHGEGTSSEHGYVMPMLAHKYVDKKKKFNWPGLTQPKLDGVRALYSSENGFWTRGGKPFREEVTAHFHMSAVMEFLPENVILDGEFMMPRPYTFQETVAHCKKFREETGPLLEYHIFDMYWVGAPQYACQTRLESLQAYILNLNENHPNLSIKFVQHSLVRNEEEMFSKHAQYVEAGYEGTMLRDMDAPYLVANRSEHLLKYKDFIDEEFTIVSVKDGDGKFEGAAVFIVELPNGKTNEVTPRGSMEDKKFWYENFEEVALGKALTVRFQGWTDDGKLRFPVGIGIRDEVQG